MTPAGRGAAAAVLAAAWLFLAAPSVPAQTRIYSFTDGEGVTYYTNMPSDPRYKPLPSPASPFRSSSDAEGRNYDEAIFKVANKHGVDPNLLRAVIKCESNFNHLAVSRAGAQGLMQLMPETARLVEVDDPFNAIQNLEGGTRYLAYLLDSFDDTRLALAAYNAGEGAVRRHGGVPPYAETRAYVAAVLDRYERYCSIGGGEAITSEDIEAFVSSEGVRLFTNTPWKYSRDSTWQRVEGQ